MDPTHVLLRQVVYKPRSLEGLPYRPQPDANYDFREEGEDTFSEREYQTSQDGSWTLEGVR